MYFLGVLNPFCYSILTTGLQAQPASPGFLFTHLLGGLSIYPSTYLIHPSIYLSIHPPIHLSVFLPQKAIRQPHPYPGVQEKKGHLMARRPVQSHGASGLVPEFDLMLCQCCHETLHNVSHGAPHFCFPLSPIKCPRTCPCCPITDFQTPTLPEPPTLRRIHCRGRWSGWLQDCCLFLNCLISEGTC